MPSLSGWNIMGTKLLDPVERKWNMERNKNESDQEAFTMALAVAISLFFGMIAALSLASCLESIHRGLNQWRTIRAELDAMDRGPAAVAAPARQPQEAFALLAA